MITSQNNIEQIDNDLFEYIIALNCSINDVYTASIIDSLETKFISNSKVKTYLDIIFDFFRKRNAVPNSTEIRTYLTTDENKHAYKEVVTQFKTLDKEYNYEELIANTERYIKERAVYHAVKTTVDTISRDEKSVDTNKTLQLFEKACNISLVDNLGTDYFNTIDSHIQQLTMTDKHVSTGYKWLDKMLGGGYLENGRALYMFNGATNVGKSIVLGNLAAKLLEQGRKVLILSLEMPEFVYAKRVTSQLSRIPFANLRTEANIVDNFLKDFYGNHPTSRLIIKEFPPNSINAVQIKAYVKKLKDKYKFKPDIIILDYLTLLQANIPTGSLYNDGKAIAEQIRALSYPAFFGCPIISAGQINRAGYQEGNPELDKTGESIGIPQTADAVFTLWQTDAEKELGLINIGIRKSRFGINFGSQKFKIDYDTLSIDETDDSFTETETVQDADKFLERLSKNG